MKHYWLPLLTFLLVGCSSSSSSVVDRYLKAVQSGDMKEQEKVFCLKSDANTSPVKSALKWSIKGEENRQAKFGGSYVLVSADVNGESNRFRVWKSDDRFANETAVYGKGFEYLNKLSDRALWSSEKNCVEVE